MMQPTFLPWQGYFELICTSDRFVFADDYQFSASSYHQRNRLFVSEGRVGWYTVPVDKQTSMYASLNQTRIFERFPWRRKMWAGIYQNYTCAPFFSILAPSIEEWLNAPAQSLADLNMAFIRLVCDLMGVQREFRVTSQCPSKLPRSERALNLLKWCEADEFLSAHGSFGYMAADGVFPVQDIRVLFQDFKPKPYLQIRNGGEFKPYLSILDVLMNLGPETTLDIVSRGTERWLTWEEMVARHVGFHPIEDWYHEEMQ